MYDKGIILLNFASKVHNFMRMASTMNNSKHSYETLLVSEPSKHVFHVELNRPHKSNSMNGKFWSEIKTCFDELSLDSDCRVVVLTGKGKNFTSGLDHGTFAEMGNSISDSEDIARSCRSLKDLIIRFQASFTALEKCKKPVICAIHGACIGGGIDMISAADIRYCTSDAYFQIKEIDLGIAADVGTLQRLPKIVGNESLVRELTFSGRKFSADEAFKFGFVSGVYPDLPVLLKHTFDMASLIAEKSPVGVQTAKDALLHARDHSVDDSLNYVATLNMSLAQSEDVKKAVIALLQKEKPVFSKL